MAITPSFFSQAPLSSIRPTAMEEKRGSWFSSFYAAAPLPSCGEIKALLLDEGSQLYSEKIVESFACCLGCGEKWRELFSYYEAFKKRLDALTTLFHLGDRAKEIVAIEEAIRKTIAELSSDRVLLLPLANSVEIHTFYLIEKKEGAYTLTLVGCDHWIADVTGRAIRYVEGREKLLSEVVYKKVPEKEFLREIETLFITPLLKGACYSPVIAASLAPFDRYRDRDREREDKLYITPKRSLRKAFSLIAKRLYFDKEKGLSEEKRLSKRLLFQSRLYTLFRLFHDAKDDIAKNPDSYEFFPSLLQRVARRASLYREKEYLSRGEIDDLQRELAVIDSHFRKALTARIVECERVGTSLQGRASAIFFSLGGLLYDTTPTVAMAKGQQLKPLSDCDLTPPSIAIDREASIGELPPPRSLRLPSTLTEEEMDAFASGEKGAILSSLAAIVSRAKQLVEKGFNSVSNSLIINTLQQLPCERILHNGSALWYCNLTTLEALETLDQLHDMSRLFAAAALPTTEGRLAVLLLTLLMWRIVEINFSSRECHPLIELPDLAKSWLRINIDVFRISNYEEPFVYKYYPIHYSPFTLNRRCSTIVESITIISEKVDIEGQYSYDAAQFDKSMKVAREQKTLFHTLFPEGGEKSLFWKERKIDNLYFFAALHVMEITGVLPDLMKKIDDEGTIGRYATQRYGNLSTSYDTGKPRFSGSMWQKSEAEERRMQKECDGTESLKLPEAVCFDPRRVLEQQLDSLREIAKEEGVILPPARRSELDEYSVEQLTDLLYLLRQREPQLEAIAFIVKHPALLAKRDLRKFLDTVLFGIGGSTLPMAMRNNSGWVTTLPIIFREELAKVERRREKGLPFAEQLLYLSSLLRKIASIYGELRINGDKTRHSLYREEKPLDFEPLFHEIDRIATAGNLLEPKRAYRWIFEKMMWIASLHVGREPLGSRALCELIELRFTLASCSASPGDIDRNEFGSMQLFYEEQAYLLSAYSEEELSSLLDALCSRLSYPLCNEGRWRGSYPCYEKGRYRIDFQELSLTTPGVEMKRSCPLPLSLTERPFFKKLFGDRFSEKEMPFMIDRGKGGRSYVLRDSDGVYGLIEEEEGSYRAYKKYRGRAPFYQMIEAAGDLLPFIAPFGFAIDHSSGKEEALAFDDSGDLCFSIAISKGGGHFFIDSLRDMRGGGVKGPFHLKSAKEASFLPFENFEKGEYTLLYLNGGSLARLHFPRTPRLSFEYREGKFYLSDPKLRGYYLRYDASIFQRAMIERSLLLQHDDEEKSKLLVVADPALSALDGRGLGELFLFSINPYSEALVAIEEAMRISASLALATWSIKGGRALEGLRAVKSIQLNISDLTKKNLALLLDFMRYIPKEPPEGSAVKIALAIKLFSLTAEKERYRLVNEALGERASRHLQRYFSLGRDLDARLILSLREVRLAIQLIALSDEEKALKILKSFSKERNCDLATFLSDVEADKLSGGYGVEKSPLSLLEFFSEERKENPPHPLVGGAPRKILFDEEEIAKFFHATALSLPRVDLTAIDKKKWWRDDHYARAIGELQNEIDSYWQRMQGRVLYTVDSASLDTLSQLLKEMGERVDSKLAQLKRAIEKSRRSKAMAVDDGLVVTATLEELSIAFLKKELPKLQREGLFDGGKESLDTLTLLLKNYFSEGVKKNLILSVEKSIAVLRNEELTAEERCNEATHLHKLLTSRRLYCENKHPELLVFECFSRKVLRNIDATTHQLELLERMVQQPDGAFQAITGAGKTTVISVLLALIKADGENLVTLRILPSLYNQSLSLLKKELGAAFDHHITPLRYNLRMASCYKEGGVRGSIFEKIYRDLLIAIKKRGCVITDYKTLPLLQGKWIKLTRQFVALRNDGIEIPAMERRHWDYLKKILLLLKKREETLMDEFDLPNKSRNRLQIPLKEQRPLLPYLYEECILLYETLAEMKELHLKEDGQKELPPSSRHYMIGLLAEKVVVRTSAILPPFAEKEKLLLDYFLGKSEELWEHCEPELEIKDRLALVKEQITTLLPLSLAKANCFDYKRSGDGKRTIPCHGGEPHEESRPGHPFEEVNSIIQDYIQKGVSKQELVEWIGDLQNSAVCNVESSDLYEKLFNELFPSRSLHSLSSDDYDAMLNELNSSWPLVREFLLRKLQKLTFSGSVISMTPQNIAAMPHKTAGISATVGCPEELPSEFKRESLQSTIRAEMVYRLLERTKSDKKPFTYSSTAPHALFNKGSFHALIDGAGAFRHFAAEEMAQHFMKVQQLEMVATHDGEGSPLFVGAVDAPLDKRGFLFQTAKTRGYDRELAPTAKGLLFVNSDKSLEELLQNEGRMRRQGQSIALALPTTLPEITSTEELIVYTANIEAERHSEGLFRAKMEEAKHLVREEALSLLLAKESLDATLSPFEELSFLFITESPHQYEKPGEFFQKNGRIQKNDKDPKSVLEENRKRWIEIGKRHKLPVAKLEELSYSDDLLGKLPKAVRGNGEGIMYGLELQEELENECEVESETVVEVEESCEREMLFDQCGDIPYFPPRANNNCAIYSAKERLFHLLDERIFFYETFLPLERRDELFKRHPFDRAMPKVATIQVVQKIGSRQGFDRVLIGDILDAAFPPPHPRDGEMYRLFDIRTKSFITPCLEEKTLRKELAPIVVQLRFINGEFESFSESDKREFAKWMQGLSAVQREELIHFAEKTLLKGDRKKIALCKPLWHSC